MRSASRLWLLALAAAIPVLTACPQRTTEELGCASDLDCGDFNRCDTANGVCRCTDDGACDASEFCNLAGSCQPKTECLSDDDCRTADNPAAICDTRAPHPSGAGTDDNVYSQSAGQCVTLSPQVSCLMDSHCPFGFFCQGSQCTPGCKDDGDCPFGDPCINGTCDPTPGACSGNGFCEYGEICQGSVCRPHAEASTLCQRCSPASLGAPCSEACLIDTSVAPTSCTGDGDCARGTCNESQCQSDADCPSGTCEDIFFGVGTCSGRTCGDYFCGSTSCSDTDPCPRGYECNLLIYVPANSSCTIGSGSSECGAPRTCLGGGENQQQGFCSCGANEDCPSIDLFTPGTCSNPGASGVCIAGATCGPQDGLLCEDLL